MNQKLQGIIIRRRRQALGWSQAALGTGVCAVSYLSRIEQGQVAGSPEVLQLLFARLGIQWRDDPGFCRELSAWFQRWYDRLFSGYEMRELGPLLRERQDDCRYSPFFLDWLLLTWMVDGQPPEEVEEFIPAMDDRQRSLYLCLTDQFEELLRTFDQSYFLLAAGIHLQRQGDYGNAVSYLQNGMERAYREGSLIILSQCCAYLANCYTGLNQLEQARKHYAIAGRMAQCLDRKEDMMVISYNLATAELQMGMTEEALGHLLEQPWEQPVYFHKLAICYECLAEKEKACDALERALNMPFEPALAFLSAKVDDPVKIRKTFEQMCRLVRVRLDDPNYLKNPQYGNLLRTCARNMERLLPASFLRFHAHWLEEWYTANRQYQKAYDVLRNIYLSGTN